MVSMIFETHKKSHSEVAKQTYEVTFTRPAGFVFVAGQYTQVALPALLYTDPKGRSRQFSIASSPQNMSEISVVFRDTGSGFKRTLLELPAGFPVQLEQGAGSFVLPLAPGKPMVFVAGGVGISSFMSYFRTVSDQKRTRQPLLLLYGNQNPESAAFRSELKTVATQWSHLQIEEIYKRPTLELFKKYTAKWSSATWFVVGPPSMVATTVHGLESAGLYPQNIIKESFEGY